ncbi:hypothetical protein NLJ89_g7609 [Agrocybe chaxingu]|uniref:Uncharacterized protein n=1 Tax=Agrocybe chaxingu TaxID=84603 RepID=A0A9W8MVA1_9AGAR|nr:hypothetical protein NLJ89_g7609 [Agrocybe chaxingu]
MRISTIPVVLFLFAATTFVLGQVDGSVELDDLFGRDVLTDGGNQLEEESEREAEAEVDLIGGKEAELAASKKHKRVSGVEAPVLAKVKTKEVRAARKDAGAMKMKGQADVWGGATSGWATIEVEEVDEAEANAGDTGDEEEAGSSNLEATALPAKRARRDEGLHGDDSISILITKSRRPAMIVDDGRPHWSRFP